jgi:hypothetical protein
MDYIKIAYFAAEEPVAGVSRGAPVKPKRTGTKSVPQDKPKNDGRKPVGKKTVVPRRAPSRGKYIDEYARAPF